MKWDMRRREEEEDNDDEGCGGGKVCGVRKKSQGRSLHPDLVCLEPLTLCALTWLVPIDW